MDRSTGRSLYSEQLGSAVTETSTHYAPYRNGPGEVSTRCGLRTIFVDGPLEHYHISCYDTLYFMATGELRMMTTAFITVIAPVEIAALPCPYALGGLYKGCVDTIIHYGRHWSPYYITYTQR